MFYNLSMSKVSKELVVQFSHFTKENTLFMVILCEEDEEELLLSNMSNQLPIVVTLPLSQ